MKETTLVTNASDRGQVERAERVTKRRETLDEQDFLWLLDQPQFRRWLWVLMAECKTFETVYDGHGSKMAHNSGRQDVGHLLLAQIQSARPNVLIQMMEEANQRKENNA